MPMGDASSSMTAAMTPTGTPAALDGSDMMMNGGGSSSSMGPMVMTFFYASDTSLFFQSWTPSSTGVYAATCVFLLLLAVSMRAMLALKPILETTVWKPRRARRGPNNAHHEMLLSDECCDEDQDRLKEQDLDPGMDASGGGFRRLCSEVKGRWYGWRFKSRWLRAMFEMSLAVLGYLLMLAVMTMNVGYFVAVIADQIKVHEADNGSGVMLHREFCGRCGGSLLEYGANAGDNIYVFYGTLEDHARGQVEPKGEFFCKLRDPWMPEVEVRRPHSGPGGFLDFDLTGTWANWRMPNNYHIEFAIKKYWEKGWLDHWRGPMQLTWGTPELPNQLGPIYVGPPAGNVEPPPITYFRPNVAPFSANLTGRSGLERTPAEQLAARFGWHVPVRAGRSEADEAADKLRWSWESQPRQLLPTTPCPLIMNRLYIAPPAVPPPVVGPPVGAPVLLGTPVPSPGAPVRLGTPVPSPASARSFKETPVPVPSYGRPFGATPTPGPSLGTPLAAGTPAPALGGTPTPPSGGPLVTSPVPSPSPERFFGDIPSPGLGLSYGGPLGRPLITGPSIGEILGGPAPVDPAMIDPALTSSPSYGNPAPFGQVRESIEEAEEQRTDEFLQATFPGIYGDSSADERSEGKRATRSPPADENSSKKPRIDDEGGQRPRAGGKKPIWGNKTGKKPVSGGKGPVWPGQVVAAPPVEQQNTTTSTGNTGSADFHDDMEIDDVIGGAHYGASSPYQGKTPSPPRTMREGSQPPTHEDPFSPLSPGNLRQFIDETLQPDAAGRVLPEPPQALDANGNPLPLAQLLHGGAAAEDQSAPPSQVSDKLPVPPLRPPPAPQPVPAQLPKWPEEFIASNEAMFGPHTERIKQYWHRYPMPAEMQTHCVANADWIMYIQCVLNPKGKLVPRTEVPIARPPSPGPLTPLFAAGPSAIPSDHPFRQSMGRGPMPNIHRQRAWKAGAIAGPPAGLCSMCNNYTQGICESDEHHPGHDRCYVCSECDFRCRENLKDLMHRFNMINGSKVYACRACTAGLLHTPSFTNGSGIDVYDARLALGDLASPETVGYDPRCYTNNHHPNEGLMIRGGVHPIHVYTGCPCAGKLLFRRLCDPHRCQAFFDALSRMYAMAAYKYGKVDKQGGGEVCFACMNNPPQRPGDRTNLSEAGRVWACLMCSGVSIGECPAQLIVSSDQVKLEPFGDAPNGGKPKLLANTTPGYVSSDEELSAGAQPLQYSDDSSNDGGNGNDGTNTNDPDAMQDVQMEGTYDEQADPLGIYH
ncbi:hypothetical protein E8E14_013539 [Neopestalotiopsis sp. 37M]|nr:hypothetical protein E8E14_013539 [Neopestalotiopsis sp. 37M]